MRRRELIFLSGALGLSSLAARAQQADRIRRIGILFGGCSETDPEPSARVETFRRQLRDLGWSDGRNVRIDLRLGAGDADRVRAHAEELTAMIPDVLAANSAPALAALARQTKTIPIVFASVFDPVGSGIVASWAHPGGNITGFSNSDPAMAGKWLELLKEIAPNVVRVLTVFDRANPAFVEFNRVIEGLAPSLHVKHDLAGVATVRNSNRRSILLRALPAEG